MRIPLECPDCDRELLEVAAIPSNARSPIRIDQLIEIKTEKGSAIAYCTSCERFWKTDVKYDEVFAGKHAGDPET